jgi:hypothetical protein
VLDPRWVLPLPALAEKTHTPDFKIAVEPLAERYDPKASRGPSRKVGYRVNCCRDVLAPSFSARDPLWNAVLEFARMVPLSIRLILETNKEQNALKVLARLKKLFDFELRGLAPYFKGGFEANIVAHLDDGPWPGVVLRAIEVAQSFGKGWGIGGAVQDEIDLSASEGFAVPGVQFAWITAIRNDR